MNIIAYNTDKRLCGEYHELFEQNYNAILKQSQKAPETLPEWISTQGGKLSYIWHKAPCKKVKKEDWNNEIQKYINTGRYLVVVNAENMANTMVYDFDCPMVRIDTSGKRSIFAHIRHERIEDIEVIYAPKGADGEPGAGYKAYKQVSFNFKRQYGLSLCKAFGTVDKEVFKWFQGSAIIEAIPGIYRGCCKADFSSAYPYQLTKPLPDANTAKTLKGRVAPSKEWPFAFYTKSHHRAIYGEASTLELVKDDTYKLYLLDPKKDGCIDPKITAEEDETILMKASPYSLEQVMRDLYEHRNEDATAKATMVCFIGFLRSVNFNWNYQGHLAAVVYLRHAAAMVEKINKIYESGGNPILYATDAILWHGKNEGIAEEVKEFGKLHLEYEDASVAIRACGIYGLSYDGVNLDPKSIKKQAIKGVWTPNTLQDIINMPYDRVKYVFDENSALYQYEGEIKQ